MRRRRTDMKQSATLQDVCNALGVSTATVSRALNNKPGVSEELRRKVLAVVKDLNYVPSAAARHLSLSRTDTLGIVFQDITAGWLLEVFRGIMSKAIESRYHVMTSLSTRDDDVEQLPKQLLSSKRIDGLVWFDPRATEKTIKAVQKEDVPFVMIQPQVELATVNTVGIEPRSGAHAAMRHLLETGHRDIVLIIGSPGNDDSRQKLSGCREALEEYDAAVPKEKILVGHHNAEQAMRAMEDYLAAAPKPPEAIFAFNDDMAIAVLNMLRSQGLRVPGDVALVGFDGIPEAVNHALTTVETPMFEMGSLAAELLINLITEPIPPARAKHLLLKGELVVRHTCGAQGRTVNR